MRCNSCRAPEYEDGKVVSVERGMGGRVEQDCLGRGWGDVSGGRWAGRESVPASQTSMCEWRLVLQFGLLVYRTRLKASPWLFRATCPTLGIASVSGHVRNCRIFPLPREIHADCSMLSLIALWPH
jgi:hypothetical protein